MTVLDSALAAYVKKLSLQPGDVLVVDPERVNISQLTEMMISLDAFGHRVPVIACPGLAISHLTRDDAVRSLQALIEMKDDELEGTPV